MAENHAEPVRTMAVSFVRKPFLFSEVLSTFLGRFIANMQKTYGILNRDGFAQFDSLGNIYPSKTVFKQSVVKNFN